MFKSCSVTIIPAHPVHVKCFLQTVSLLVGSQIHMKERKQRRVQTDDRNLIYIPETVFVTFESSGVCNENDHDHDPLDVPFTAFYSTKKIFLFPLTCMFSL